MDCRFTIFLLLCESWATRITLSQELDIEKLKEHKSAGAPFMEFRDPDGDTFYAYALKATEDLRNHESKRFNRIEKHAIVTILALKPEGAAVPRTRRNEGEFVEVGQSYSVNFSRHTVLKRATLQLDPIGGKVLHVMNRGKRKSAKPGGKDYWDYVVVPVTGEMNVSQLLALEVDAPEEGDEDL